MVRLVTCGIVHHVDHHESSPAQFGKPGAVGDDADRAGVEIDRGDDGRFCRHVFVLD
jgi:hypothetical protein